MGGRECKWRYTALPREDKSQQIKTNDTLGCYGDICDAVGPPRIPQDAELPTLVVSRAVPGGRSTLEPLLPLTPCSRQRGPQGPPVQGVLQSFRPTPRMLPVGGASPPKKHSVVPNLMEKGLMLLQCVAGRDNLVPDWKLRRRQRSLSKSAQAISRFYRKKVRGPGGDGQAAAQLTRAGLLLPLDGRPQGLGLPNMLW